jgi:hypothetical protein
MSRIVMKKRAIYIVLFCLSSAFASAQEDYYHLPDSSFSFSESDIQKFSTKSAKRMSRLAASVQFANNKYLRAFIAEEDALLHSLCSIPLPRDNKLQGNAPAVAEIARNAESNISFTYLASFGAQDVKNCTPPEKQSTEQRADYLIQNAWYAFNRFENMCQRNKEKNPLSTCNEMDSLNMIWAKLLQFNKKSTVIKETYDRYLESKKELNYELKRSELIEQYITERQLFLENVLKDIPGASKGLHAIHSCSHYFKAQIKEYKSIFNDKAAIENKFCSIIRNQPTFADPFKSDISGALEAMRKMNTAKRPSLTLNSMMKSVPVKTQTLLNSLQLLIPFAGELNLNNIIKSGTLPEILPTPTKAEGSEVDEAMDDSAIDTLAIAPAENPGKCSPNPRYNPLRTKRMIDRFSLEFNNQFNRKTQFLPSGSNTSCNINYQLFTKANIGLGASYISTINFPRSEENQLHFPQVNFSNGGLGFRSYFDLGLKKKIFIKANYERNYRTIDSFKTLTNSRWTQSALIGFSIKYSTQKRMNIPTMDIQYDLLHNQNGQPAIVVRAGLNIRRKHAFHANY